jgi:hypothetical protein
MKKLFVLLLTLTMIVNLVACSGSNNGQQSTNDPGNTEGQSDASKDLEYSDVIKINFAMGNNQRTLTYQQSTPLTMPDGRVITQGQLKPVWQYISQEIGIKIDDVTVQDQPAREMMDVSAATNFRNATIYGGNSTAEALMSYGAQGYFVNLNDYLEYMPNFSAYLNENPAIKTSITAFDGGIYYTPYAAEINNYARVFNGRQTWVKTLLDSEEKLETESATLNVQYEGYWDRNATNVVTLQNQAANNGRLNQEVALKVLLDYIAETYPELENPSELYLGDQAKYDIDELVALLRVIKLSPNTLTKVTTGSVVSNAIITPYFVRESRYREDLLRLATYFGGQRVYGSDSYNSTFYLDENGELQFSYIQDDFLESMTYIRAMYEEGLIHTEFADVSNKENFRVMLYSRDDVEGQRQFGFMTYDWTASTTATNPDVIAMLPPLTTVGSNEFIHYVENTRVIKPDGWGISTAASEKEINSAIKLFDYMYSEEGNIVQNYGTPELLDQGEKFVAPDGTEYPKFNQWVNDAANEFKSGDGAAFLRDFLGGILPVGYQKEIGFELQYTEKNGWESWDIYNNAKVQMPSYNASNPLFLLVPSVFSLTEQDLARLGNTAVGTDQTEAIFLFLSGSNDIKNIDQIKKLFEDGRVNQYVEVYRNAYNRMVNQ